MPRSRILTDRRPDAEPWISPLRDGLRAACGRWACPGAVVAIARTGRPPVVIPVGVLGISFPGSAVLYFRGPRRLVVSGTVDFRRPAR